MKGKIVVATDGSETGNRAIDHAAQLSGRFGRDLCIVHVLMHGRPGAEFARMAEVEGLVRSLEAQGLAGNRAHQEGIDRLFASAEDEVAAARLTTALGEHILAAAQHRAEDAGAQSVSTHLCAGDYADEILDLADAERAGMIVVGRRGLGRFREALLGSVSQKVLHQAGVIVTIVP